MADRQVAAFAGKRLIKGIGAQNGRGRNLVVVAQSREALQVDIGLQPIAPPQVDVSLNDAELAHHALGTNVGMLMYPRRGGNLRGRIDGHSSL